MAVGVSNPPHPKIKQKGEIFINRVSKYLIDFGITVLTLPKGAKPLSILAQYDSIQLYALTDNDTDESENWQFTCFSVGHGLPDDIDSYHYLGNFGMCDNRLGFHVFGRIFNEKAEGDAPCQLSCLSSTPKKN